MVCPRYLSIWKKFYFWINEWDFYILTKSLLNRPKKSAFFWTMCQIIFCRGSVPQSISDVPQMVYGNKSTDGGFLFLTAEELLKKEPAELRKSAFIMERVEKVRHFRLSSTKAATKKALIHRHYFKKFVIPIANISLFLAILPKHGDIFHLALCRQTYS